MKKWFALMLTLCCLVSLLGGCKSKKADEDDRLFQEVQPGDRQPSRNDTQQGQDVKYEAGLVAEPLDAVAMAQTPANGLQDLRYWDPEEASLRDEPSELNDEQIWCYKTEMDTVEAYIRMLQKNGWTLVDEEEGYKGGYRSWGLTCDGAPEADKFGQMFTDTPCHLSIHWTDSEHYKFTFAVSEDIQVLDMGLRREGGSVSVAPVGQSACAGLERLTDGSYRTTDGRLEVFPGSAMVIRDGKEYVVDVGYDNDGRYEVLQTEHYYRDEGIKLKFPENSLMEGDTFRLWDLDIFKAYWESDGKSAATSLLDYLQVYIAHEDEWTCPGRNDDDYESLFVRLMYRDKGGDMVLYVCARFDDDEPETVEALIAVDTSNSGGEVRDVTYLQVGDKITLRYNPPADSASYMLYTWQILEGDENVWIDGGETTCTVRALDAGSAVIRVTYEYTEAGYNVLTGNPENQPRSVTQDYYFIIE